MKFYDAEKSLSRTYNLEKVKPECMPWFRENMVQITDYGIVYLEIPRANGPPIGVEIQARVDTGLVIIVSLNPEDFPDGFPNGTVTKEELAAVRAAVDKYVTRRLKNA